MAYLLDDIYGNIFSAGWSFGGYRGGENIIAIHYIEI